MNMHRTVAMALLAAGILASGASHANGFACSKPFQATGPITIAVGSSGNVGSAFVPAGYLFQVEYVSAQIRLADTAGRASFAISTTTGGLTAWHELPIQQGYSVFDRQTSGVVSFFADPGSIINVSISRTSATTTVDAGTFTLTGCLVKSA